MRPSPEITVPVLEGKTDAKTEAVIDRTACKKGRRKKGGMKQERDRIPSLNQRIDDSREDREQEAPV
ncbi:hypothetical protein E3N88_31018 [Mikania micrantha]|uniref:Uncharacterized protein n=1 Tax=Mikania micrantha TaxID=192012 RepID=A0A5N6MR75_9ASTR|nr:hypothetical protein E3N88_31018 [Mikania micrantha]